MHKLIITLLVSLLLTACGSEKAAVHGKWQSLEIPFNGQLKTDTWEFNSDSSFTLTSVLRNSSGQTSTLYSNGEFMLGDKYQSESGLTITSLDLIYYGQDTVKPTQRIVGANYTTYLDALYMNENTIYFGNLNVLETCEGEFYAIDTANVVIVDGHIRDFEEVSECYARPSSINLNTPYFKLTSAD